MPQHLLRESWIRTQTFKRTPQPLPQANSSIHGAKRSFAQGPALAAVSVSPQVQRCAKVYQKKIWPTALQADRSESIIWTTQGWMMDGKKHVSTGSSKTIQRTSFTDKWCSSTLLGSLLLSYCTYGEVLQWVSTSSSPEEESSLSRHRCIKKSREKEAYKDWMLAAKCYQPMRPAKARLQTRIQIADSICLNELINFFFFKV